MGPLVKGNIPLRYGFYTQTKTPSRYAQGGLLATAFALLVLLALYYRPLAVLPLQHVEIRNNTIVSTPFIRSYLGLNRPLDLLQLNLGGMKSRLEALPAVKQARISLSKLPGTLTITLRERRFIGTVAINGQHLLLDSQGKVYDFLPGLSRQRFSLHIDHPATTSVVHTNAIHNILQVHPLVMQQDGAFPVHYQVHAFHIEMYRSHRPLILLPAAALQANWANRLRTALTDPRFTALDSRRFAVDLRFPDMIVIHKISELIR